jgi:hypothetical protein
MNESTIDFELNTAMLLLNAVEVKGEQNLNNVLAAIQRIRNARKLLKEEEKHEDNHDQQK